MPLRRPHKVLTPSSTPLALIIPHQTLKRAPRTRVETSDGIAEVDVDTGSVRLPTGETLQFQPCPNHDDSPIFAMCLQLRRLGVFVSTSETLITELANWLDEHRHSGFGPRNAPLESVMAECVSDEAREAAGADINPADLYLQALRLTLTEADTSIRPLTTYAAGKRTR